MNAAILLAAGLSQRMAQAGLDKALMPIAGKVVLSYSIAAFLESAITHTFWITYRDEYQLGLLRTIATDFPQAHFHWVLGGSTRAQSVGNALNALPSSTQYVYVHDSARPLITTEALNKLQSAVHVHGAAALAHKVTDTIKRICTCSSGPAHLEDLDRSKLWSMQTPQAFKYSIIQQAYALAPLTITDDTAAVSLAGYPVQLVENSCSNPKITTSEDIAYIEYLLIKKLSSHT